MNLYRIENSLDSDYLRLDSYKVLRETPKGYWISCDRNFPKTEKFVLKGPGKRFAYPDISDALESFRIRKRRQVQHGERKVAQAIKALKLAENWTPTEVVRYTFPETRLSNLTFIDI